MRSSICGHGRHGCDLGKRGSKLYRAKSRDLRDSVIDADRRFLLVTDVGDWLA